MKSFIAFLFVLLIGVAICSEDQYPECPKICDYIYFPICGSDGVEENQFSNHCNLDITNCKRRHDNKPEFKILEKPYCDESRIPDGVKYGIWKYENME